MKTMCVTRTLGAALVALLAIVIALAFGVAGAAQPAQAHAGARRDTSGYAMTVTADSTDVPYWTGAKITATLTYPAGSSPSTSSLQYAISINGQSYTPTIVTIQPSINFIAYLPVESLPGEYSVVATYIDPSTNVAVSSAPLTITVAKISGQVSCGAQIDSSSILSINGFYKPGQTITMALIPPLFQGQGGSDPVITWANTSVTVTFTGATTVTDPNITPDSSGQFSVSAPTPIGGYHVTCAFSGDKNYATASSTFGITVSQEHALGPAQLYSNPTSPDFSTTQPFTLYLVLHAAPGLPTPTGRVHFDFVSGTTANTALKPDGTLLTKIYPEVPPVGGIAVYYMGDRYYAPVGISFGNTNPPIPGSASGAPGSRGGSAGTAGATATPKPSATVTATATNPASTGVTSGVTSSEAGAPHGISGPNWALIAGLALFSLALAGGGVGGLFFFRSRRAHRAAEEWAYTQRQHGQQ